MNQNINNYKIPSEETFSAVRDVNIQQISVLSPIEMRYVLPSLVRIGFCTPLDHSQQWIDKRKHIQQILSGIENVNSIVSLLSSDFHALEIDAKREHQLKSKIAANSTDSVLISSLTDGLALEFERADGVRKLRLLLSELISLMAFVRNLSQNASHSSSHPSMMVLRPSELFDNDVYLDDVSDVLCIALSELPNTLQMLDVTEALLYVKNGSVLICRLVANAPETFHDVCTAILNNGEKQDEESLFGRIRMNALRLLCRMNPAQSLIVKSEAVELCRMPSLTIMLSLDYLRMKHNTDAIPLTDIVSFITGILLGNDDKVRTWFAQYIRIGQKRMDQGYHTSLTALRSELIKSLNSLIESITNGSESEIVLGGILLRLYCALRGVASMKFTDEETNAILNLITCHPPACFVSVRFVSLGLCMLLSCPQLITNGDNETKAIEWIKWLIQEESYFGRVANDGASFCEMLLLVAIHFHSNQMVAIGELVSSTLGIKILIRQNNLTKIRSIFTQEIFTDQIVTAHAVKVPVTLNLNSNIVGFLPVHCIYQLLKSRAFTKHKVPIKDWIFKQICNASAPIHPILSPLIEAYVNSVIVPSSKTALHTTNEPITESEISKVFKYKVYSIDEKDDISMDTDEAPSCALTSQLLLLYYVLLYEDVRLTHMKTIVMTDRKILKYSSEFIAQLPIFYLIQKARIEQQKYGVLFPPLLRVVSLHYPHLCLVQDWLASEKKITCKQLTVPISVKEERQIFISSFDSKSSVMVSALERLLILPTEYLWPLAPDFVSKLPVLLIPDISSQILEKAKKVWWRLNTIFPKNLWVITVNSLRPKLFPFADRSLTWSDIVLDPLHVLRCDERVFRNVPLMEITLHILRAYLAASRTHLSRHLLERPSKNPEEEKDREELRIALLAAQESAAIQILLECCLTRHEDIENGLSGNLRDVQNLICSHLHQEFISDPNIAKLVHFQGYPSELLPLAVSRIPSMHICLDFIPELLSQSDLQKQAFAIELCSYLCKQYAIVKSLSVAKLCFNVSMTLLSLLPSDRRSSFFICVTPALVRMCDPFPPLCDDAIKLLIQLSQIHMSFLASSSPHFIFPESILKLCPKFNDEIDWGTLMKYFVKLPSTDALCLTLRLSFEELCAIKKNKVLDL